MNESAGMADPATIPNPPIYDRVIDIIGREQAQEMDHHRAAAEGAQAMADRHARVVLTARAVTALDLLEEHDAQACGAVVSAWVERLGAHLPIPGAESVRGDALFWAETALELELVEYLAAGLRELGVRGTGALLLPARKRLLVALFMSMPDAERRTFLAKVDPRGVFTGRAA